MQRAGEPTFDMVVELERGQVHTWSVIKSVGLAVDCLLKGGKYKVEKRVRLETKSEDSDDGSRKVSRLDYRCGLGGRWDWSLGVSGLLSRREVCLCSSL